MIITKKVLIVIMIFVLVSISTLLSVPLVATGEYGTGVYLEFRFFRSSSNGYVEETNIISSYSDVLFCVRLEVVVPPPEDTLTIMFRCFNKTIGPPAIFIPYSRIESLRDKWIDHLKEQNVPDKALREHVFGLLIHAIVINTSSREVLYNAIDSIPVKLGDLMSPQFLHYTLYVRKNIHQIHYVLHRGSVGIISAHSKLTMIYKLTQDKGSEIEMQGSWECFFPICYEVLAEIKPESLVSYLPSTYFITVNNKLYMKTPILIVENTLYFSGTVNAWITLKGSGDKVQTRLTFASGEIYKKILNGTLPSVNLNLGGATWGGTYYRFDRSLFLPPETSGWVYIWARPIQKYYKVYYLYEFGITELGDEVDSLITDILLNGYEIQGGTESGLPHQLLMDNFFKGTNSSNVLCIPGTCLSDCKLDPGEAIAYEFIIKNFDTCGSGFEIGLPVGAIAALAVCAALSSRIPGIIQHCPTLVTFASAFQVSAEYEPLNLYIDGALQNYGSYLGIGYNTPELIYTRVSIYKYSMPPPWWCFWCSPCQFSVPAGLYIESR